jgi:putative sterol carrier protein
VRLVSLRRIRTQSVDAMMRWMPQYFRPSEAKGLAFTMQYHLTGEGGGDWAMRVADEHCEVRPGAIEAPDLTVTMPAMLFLAVHRGEASPVLGVLTGRIRLKGQRRLFPLLARLFPTETGGSILHRLAFHARQWLRRRRAQGGKA